jgi:D-inositol-3-phosphate glycosyltransferase
MFKVYLYPAGQAGMALYSYKLANALAGHGLDVSLFVDDQYELDHLPASFTRIRGLSSKNVSARSKNCPIIRTLKVLIAHFHNWSKLFRHVKKDRPDIIHVQPQFYLMDWCSLALLKKKGFKIVVTIHDVIPHKFFTRHFHWAELLLLQFMYDEADKLIVHSKRNKRQLLDRFSLDESRVIVIPHGEYGLDGLSREISKIEARSMLGLDENEKVLLFFGFIRRVKGIETLLRAFDSVAEALHDAILIIVGCCIQGESFTQYEAQLRRMLHGDRVKVFLEYVKHKEVSAFFRAADIVVLPYLKFSSQSGVLHLAQGFGKATIVTDVGGMPEAVEDYRTGLVVPPGDAEKLAKGIIYLLTNEEKRIEMGRLAREVALKEFSWDAIARRTIESVYSNLEIISRDTACEFVAP